MTTPPSLGETLMGLSSPPGRDSEVLKRLRALLGTTDPEPIPFAEYAATYPEQHSTRPPLGNEPSYYEGVHERVRGALPAIASMFPGIGEAMDVFDVGAGAAAGDWKRAGLGLAGLALPAVGGRALAKAGELGSDAGRAGGDVERITGATIRDPNTGKVYVGRNHGDALNTAADDGASWSALWSAWDEGDDQVAGFATNLRGHITRDEAMRLTGQDPQRVAPIAEELVGKRAKPGSGS